MTHPAIVAPRRPVRVVLADGAVILLRPLRPTDRERYLRGWNALSERTKYLRFGRPKPDLSDKEVEAFLGVDGVERLALVATGPDGQEMIAVGRVAPASIGTDVGEVGVVVADVWQGRGIGTALLDRLLQLARTSGYRRLVATSLVDNLPVRALLHSQGFHWVSSSFGTVEWETELIERCPRTARPITPRVQV